MYPKEVDLMESRLIDKSDITMDEFNRITPVKNRTEFLNTKINVVFTENGQDNRVAFPLPGYSKKTQGESKETKNKL